MPLFRKKVVFAATTENTPGTAEGITEANAVFNVQNFELQNETEMQEVPGQGGFGRLPSVPGPYRATATFRTNIGYDGTTIGNWASVLFPACGVVNSGGVFSPLAESPGTNVKTLTIARYCDGKRRFMYGCVGTFQWFFPTGELPYIDWTFSGVWGGESDIEMIEPNYPNTETPLRASGGATTYGGVNFCAAACTFDIGNVIEPIHCNNGSKVEGFDYFMVVDRNPKITTDPLSVLVGTQNRYGSFFAGTEAAFSMSIAAPSNSSITLAAPKAQIIRITEGDRGMMCMDDMDLQCNKNVDAANQEFSITFS